MIQICLPFSLTICCVVGISIKIILANKPLWALREGGALWRSAWLQVGTCASLTWSRRPFSSSSFAKGGQTEVVDEPVGPSVLNSTQAEHFEGKKYRTRQFTVWNCGSENRAKIISAQRHFFHRSLRRFEAKEEGEGKDKSPCNKELGSGPILPFLLPSIQWGSRWPWVVKERQMTISEGQAPPWCSLSLGNVSIYQISFCFLMKL